MHTSVFQYGIIMLDCGPEVQIYERGPYGYNCSMAVSES